LILDEIAADDRFGHTSHFQVRIAGATVVDEQLRGPMTNNVFSITKSVLASALRVMAARDLLPPLDSPVADFLPQLRETAARSHTWRHLLTMTSGPAVDGAWEIDAVAASPNGHVPYIANAPQLCPPGAGFGYDNGGPHLMSAATTEILGEAMSGYTARHLFARSGCAASTDRPIRMATRPGRTGLLRLSADALGASSPPSLRPRRRPRATSS
jgi:CubicO group peptidase (beta-lactamase class C family)